MDVNFNLLRTFLRVAEHGSFRDASEDVHRSQSAVSAQIKLLERQVGAVLFHRTTRSVQLTMAGRQLLQAGQKGLREIEAGLREIQETIDLHNGRVSLACSPIMAATRLPALLAAFEHDYPDVRVLVREQTPADLFASVLRGDADFGLGPALDAPELDFAPLLQEDTYALVPRRLLAADATTIGLKALAGMPVLLLGNATSLRTLLDDAARRIGIALDPKYECTQAQTLIAMANAQLGAAVLPKSVVPEKPHRTVQALRIVAPVLTRQIGLITVKGRSLSPAAHRLAQLMRDATDLVPAGRTGRRMAVPAVPRPRRSRQAATAR